MKLCPIACVKLLKPCPCGNDSDFDLKTPQVSEDLMECYIVCGVCGHDPANKCGQHVECVHGARDPMNVSMAGDVWNEAISENSRSDRPVG